MAIDFISGFETGDFSEWDIDSGNCSVQGIIKHSGSYSCRFNPSSAQAYIAHTSNCMRVSLWLYIVTAPSPGTRICGRETQLSLFLDGPIIRLKDGGNTLASFNLIGLDWIGDWAENWHRISLSFDPTNNAAKVYVDGREVISVTNATSSSDTGGVYGCYDSTSCDIYLDDIVQDDIESTGDLGDIRVLKADIVGAGNYTEFDSYEGSATHYENVDELSPSDADYNWNSASGAAKKECYALENCSSIGLVSTDLIMAVQTICRMKRGGGGGTVHNILRRDNGVDYEVAKSLTTSWVAYFHVDPVMPNGEADWTQDRFDAFEVGMSYNGGGQDPFISWVSVMVAYCPGIVGTIVSESFAYASSTLDEGGGVPPSGITSAQSSVSGVAKVLKKVIGTLSGVFFLTGSLTEVEREEDDEVEKESKKAKVRMPSAHIRPDNQNIVGGAGIIIILGPKSDNQQLMGEGVVNLDIDSVIGT